MSRWWRDWTGRFRGWLSARTIGLRELWAKNFGTSAEIEVNEERLGIGDINF